MTETQKRARTTTERGKTSKVFTDEERAAMQESVRERKAASRRSPEEERAEGERDVLAKISEMPEPDRGLAERIHALVTASAPLLVPRTYYGMPAYARDGKVVCFFKPASKFKERYATFGFETAARLDDGAVWPVAFAITRLTSADEARIGDLVKKAAG